MPVWTPGGPLSRRAGLQGEQEAPGATSGPWLWGVGGRGRPWGLGQALCLPQPCALPPAASGSRDHNPAVVVTVVTVSALLVLGSVMSVLAMWRR